MKLVTRHLAGDFLRLFLTTSGAFLSLFLVVSFFEQLRIFLKFKAAAWDAVIFLAASIPWMVYQTAPLAVLVATLLSVTLLARHGELTAFRCGGVSLRRLAVPYLVCGLAISLGNFVLQEVVVPRTASFAREVRETRIRKRSGRALIQAENLWLRLGNRILHVEKVVPEQNRLLAVSVIEMEQGRVSRRIDARDAIWAGDHWTLTDAESRIFSPGGEIQTEQHAHMTYPLSEGPEDFRIAKFDPEEMSIVRLRRLIRRYHAQGLSTRDLEVGLWGKTSLPFASLVMPLLGFPFALRRSRQGGASLGIAMGVGIGFVYWLTLAVGLSLGKAGWLPTPLGAWAGNILFGVVGAVLLWRAERV